MIQRLYESTADENSGRDSGARPCTGRFAGTLVGAGALIGLLLAAVLAVAYVWQPPATASSSPYLAGIRSRHAETSVGRFHYKKTGRGSPVVLVAGAQWIYSYRHTVPALAGHHTVYAVDLPGQGHTTVKRRRLATTLTKTAPPGSTR